MPEISKKSIVFKIVPENTCCFAWKFIKMCKVTLIASVLFQFLVMSLILKLATSFDFESELPKVNVRLSTSVVESSAGNDHQQVELNNGRQQRSLSPQREQQDQHYVLEPRKLHQFKTEDAILPNLARSFEVGQEANTRNDNSNNNNNYYHDYINTNKSPSSTGRIIDYQQNYPKSISTSYSISPIFMTTQEPSQHRMVSRQTASQTAQRDQSRSGSTSRHNNSQLGSDINCHRKSLGKILKGARSLLTDGFSSFQDYATSGNLMLGSSLLAAAIPLGALIIPGSESRKRRAGLSTDEQSSLSRFSLQSRVDSMMGWIERSVEHLPNIPRLHPQECVKRSICEAHNNPNKYGAIGFMLRLLFPATNLSITDRMDNMEFKVINKYRHAAGYGFNKRIDNNGTESPTVCKEKYEDCLVSLLDVGRNLMDIFLN